MGGKTKAVEAVEKICNELLEMLGVEGRGEVSEKDEVIEVDIKTAEPGILIGFRGETLRSFQLILSLLVYKKMGEWIRVLVDIEDYRKNRNEQIREMAERYAAEALELEEEVVMPELSSYERRIIHTHFSGSDKIKTESVGEGRERRLVLKPKGAAEKAVSV